MKGAINVVYEVSPDGNYQSQAQVPPDLNAQAAVIMLGRQMTLIAEALDVHAIRNGFASAKAAPKEWLAKQQLQHIMELGEMKM